MAAPDVISWGGDLSARLKQSQMGRPMPWGDNWTRIRVGILFGCEDTGASLASVYQMFLGVASGSTNWYYDASATYCVGARVNPNEMTRHTVPRTSYFIKVGDPGGIITSRKINVTVVDTARHVDAAANFCVSTVSTNPYGLWWELDRVTEVANVMRTTSDLTCTPAMFMDAMSCASLTNHLVLAGNGYIFGAGRVIGLSPATGPLDHAVFGANTAELYTYVTKFAVAKVL